MIWLKHFWGNICIWKKEIEIQLPDYSENQKYKRCMSVISKISQLEGKVVNVKSFPSSSTTLCMFQVPIFGLLPYAMKGQYLVLTY
ncbi:hypothetical protein GQ457_16G005260 [Hibiscus cannabinus]